MPAATHTVQQGECLTRIAARYGFTDWRTLYNHPVNAPLRQKRPNPNVLFPGDLVRIPANRVKEEQLPTGRLHRFVIQAPHKFLRIVFRRPDNTPIADEPYILILASGRRTQGRTSPSGLLHEPIPLHETAATLHIAARALPLNLGHLNPNGDVATEDLSGIQARLNNLGYSAGPNDGRYGRNTRAALALFQLDEDLDPSGLPDEDTLPRLEQRHGC